jgi:hypothetical protein
MVGRQEEQVKRKRSSNTRFCCEKTQQFCDWQNEVSRITDFERRQVTRTDSRGQLPATPTSARAARRMLAERCNAARSSASITGSRTSTAPALPTTVGSDNATSRSSATASCTRATVSTRRSSRSRHRRRSAVTRADRVVRRSLAPDDLVSRAPHFAGEHRLLIERPRPPLPERDTADDHRTTEESPCSPRTCACTDRTSTWRR